jgi:hypothetical protein
LLASCPNFSLPTIPPLMLLYILVDCLMYYLAVRGQIHLQSPVAGRAGTGLRSRYTSRLPQLEPVRHKLDMIFSYR